MCALLEIPEFYSGSGRNKITVKPVYNSQVTLYTQYNIGEERFHNQLVLSSLAGVFSADLVRFC